MNKISYLFIFPFLLIATTMYADKTWIAIEPINTSKNTTHETAQSDINISQIQPVSRLIENVKVIKQLIDSANSLKKPDIQSEKNWYVIDTVEEN